jgi:TonB family protein
MTGDGPSVVAQLTSANTKAAIDSAFDGVDVALASNDGDNRPGSVGSDTGDIVAVKGPRVSNKRAKVKSRKRKTKVKAKLKIKAPSEAVGAGTLSPEKIARTISRKYRGAINGCYESELKKDNSLKGALKIQFTISERGRISNSRILRNSLGSKAVGKCIRNHMKRWRFPKPKGGSVTTSIPLVFTPSS